MKPFLKITSVSFAPESPRAKHDLITIHATVKNISSAPLPYRCSFYLDLYASNQDGNKYDKNGHPYGRGRYLINGFLKIPLLEPGGETHFDRVFRIPESGYHTIVAHMDTSDNDDAYHGTEQIRWDGEYIKKTFYVREAPQPTDIVLDKVEKASDGRLRISMHNTGENIPDTDFNSSYVKVTLNGSTQRIMKLSEIDPNGLLKTGWSPNSSPMIHVTFVWPARTGVHSQDGIDPSELDESTVRVHVNYNGSIAETNCWNNIIEKYFSANPGNVTERNFGNLPDLALCSFKIIRFTKGQSYPIHLVVRNFGPGPSVSSRLIIWVEGFPMTSYTIPALATGDHYDIFHDVRFDRTGQYRFNATIDAGNPNDEVVENNNEWHGQIFVNEPGGDIPHTIPSDFGCSNTSDTRL